MFTVQEEVLCLEGHGAEEKFALQDIFNQIKPKLTKKYSGVLLQIEPLAMRVTDAEVHTYTERFMGILFPRRRHSYRIVAEITVKVSHFDTSGIDYRRSEEQLSVLQHALKMR